MVRWGSVPDRDTAATLEALQQGRLDIVGRLVEASNGTFYCDLAPPGAPADEAAGLHAVYKPIRGERPLDDFPHGTLALREVAAWEVSRELGGDVVPPTVLRDGPLGEGSVQLWVEVDETQDVLRLILTRDDRLRRVAILDALINNADRKGGHLLPVADGSVHGCDHGICFATASKLRTVLWGWHGEPLATGELADVARLRAALDGSLGDRLADLLARPEVDATRRRADALLDSGRFPTPDPRRRVIPWPPF